MDEKHEALEMRAALIEMYKAGFLDGYQSWKNLKTDDDWQTLNKFYKMSFMKRFAKKITKALKKKK